MATGLFGFGMKEEDEQEEARPLFTENDVAIRGIDPVACFTDGGPVPANPDHAAEWGGAMWHFASAQTATAFLTHRTPFAPQYGGFCAWAVAEQGELYATDPQGLGDRGRWGLPQLQRLGPKALGGGHPRLHRGR